MEIRPLAVALNQAKNKQRNKILEIFLHIVHNGNRIKRREDWFKRERQSYIEIALIVMPKLLLLYYYYYYYYYYYIRFQLNARYVYLYT